MTPDYERQRTLQGKLAGQPITWVAKPGIPGWDGIGPADELLFEAAEPAEGQRLLVLGCGHGALAAALARRSPSAQLLLSDHSVVALALARATLAANRAENAELTAAISLLPERAGQFDAATLVAPPDRRLARRRLVEAFGALRAGGSLFLAGANDHGIRSVIADAAELFGAAHVLSYRQGHRVAQALKPAEPGPAPEWAGAPGIAPGTWREFAAVLRGHELRLCSVAGVFAHDKLDAGTRVLLETIESPAGARVLDLGCGCGVIGALAARLGAATADLADANLLAVAAARATLARNEIANARVFAADGVPPGEPGRYDLVLSNPPFHAGKAIDYDVAHAFIAQAGRALRAGGHLVLVANQFLPYEPLLRASFGQVAQLAQREGYRLWRALR